MLKRITPYLVILWSVGAMAETYVVGVENIEYYPYYTTTDDGRYQGHARALLDAFAADNGHQFTYRPLPVSRLMDTYVNGDVDLKYPDNPNWGGDVRQQYDFHYSEPVVEYIDGVVAPERIEQLSSLSTVRGFTPWAFMDQVGSGAVKLHQQNNMTQLIRFVMAGRAQGAYFNIEVLKARLEEMGQSGELTFQEHLPHDQSHYFLSSIQHPDLIEQFNAWLQRNPDTVADISAEFGVNR